MTPLEKFAQNNPDVNLWEHIQQHPEQTELLFGIEAAQLFKLIEQVKSLCEAQLASNSELNNLIQKHKLSLDQQILLTILVLVFIKDKKSFNLLKRIFKLAQYNAKSIIDYWIFILNRNREMKELILLSRYPENIEFASQSNKEKYIRITESGASVNITTGSITQTARQQLDINTNTFYHHPISLNQACIVSNSVINDVPFYERLDKLPHNALFLRRNNQFGTRLAVGIKDLIEQGVLIDQTNIRFDDFVAPNSEKIPSPSDGFSIGVSYGITSIPLNQKRDDRATHYLEIALKASDAAPSNQAKNQAPPVNYVFVIDTSGSMDGE